MAYFNTRSVAVVHGLIFLGVLMQPSLAISKADEEKRIKELLEWEAPIEMQRTYPYYFLGNDKSGNPVWLLTSGRWDVRWLSEGGKKFEPLYQKYAEQMVQRWYHSALNFTQKNNQQGGKELAEEENAIEGFIVINDLDGYSHRQYLHPPTVKKLLEAFQVMFNVEMINQGGTKHVYCINVNFAARSVWALIDSILGEFGTKFELYGTNASKWKHALLRQIPMETLPKYMGGTNDLKSVKTFGK